MQIKLVAIVALATGCLADLYTVNSIKKINQATIEYHKSLTDWTGDYAGGVVMLKKSRDLINSIKAAGTHPEAKIHRRGTPEEDEKLEQEGFDVAHSLVGEIRSAVDTAIATKPKIEAVPVVGKRISLYTFEKFRSAASDLGGVFSPKASPERLEEAQDIVKRIDDEFARGYVALK
ncbi:hypothetical protein G7Z17_g3333 [Cylindrodendrum hubeiense]|uniref:Uncharacterized protein n=1 Tax=Cylindrodendrum hubeiense TaxID=595255 RepID=A0A9P5HEW1_9HYPO|nr:hypothetical protein G7Z17_g3333 [Cylindrodendrum hubeiense]